MYRKARSHSENGKHSGGRWEANSQQPQIFIYQDFQEGTSNLDVKVFRKSLLFTAHTGDKPQLQVPAATFTLSFP